ncbi:putative polysaccharide biosynthesis/export domain protein [Treponema primitia ZAS-2]|uniref:Putative polysaccharide biosynthesis/export domain protein n=1 Tax=Treponema primitia (strain ATCC BAA-887 / DSM 12427 / ZAS-2) TaxID=545694 RepID=F5YP00_TREPZ|nr:SLBB domain-containing protein [Treponema primitia]AEF83894.1 putative polysaccharide biosynthesis/export domain protein [Treponema primitia ZAS-2]
MKLQWLTICFLLISLRAFAQEPSVSKVTESEALSRYAQLALSSPDYRVTAGDIYTLEYAAGTVPVIYKIVVDTSYRIKVSNLGVINATGKSYQQLKSEVEAIVTNNYPLSGVQLVLTEPASFRVRISGEVQNSREIATWALARLSGLLGAENLTSYSSLRDVSVTSLNGQTRAYDLFKAQRFGDMSQDPYVRPGDVITVNRITRVVSVTGEVERPGEYQLLPGESLRELVDYYASGLSPIADPSRIELVRQVGSAVDSGDKIYLTRDAINSGYPLQHLDTIRVPSIAELIPVMFVEGAVRVTEEGDELTTATRLTIRFNAGENYASLVQRNQAWFSAISDTKNAYLIRGAERIPLNLNPMLYDSSYRSQYLVEHNDTLIIPFRQYFVTVSGAVYSPGRFPYIPDRSWDYYIGLAGGFLPERNTREKVDIVDLAGKKLTKKDIITPETNITARANSGLYYFNQYGPVITTVLSVVSTFITVTLLITQ